MMKTRMKTLFLLTQQHAKHKNNKGSPLVKP